MSPDAVDHPVEALAVGDGRADLIDQGRTRDFHVTPGSTAPE